jgi:hypothetical protein
MGKEVWSPETVKKLAGNIEDRESTTEEQVE